MVPRAGDHAAVLIVVRLIACFVVDIDKPEHDRSGIGPGTAGRAVRLPLTCTCEMRLAEFGGLSRLL